MNPSAGVSIIICTWNRAQTLRATLESLAALQVPAGSRMEVVVVDNNSTDDTRSMVEGMIPAWSASDLRYVFEPRQGKQFALNRGIAAASHDILAFSDDDILFPADWVQQILHVFSDDAADLVGGRTLIRWPAAGQPAWYHPNMSAVLGAVDLGDARLLPAPADYAPAGANLVARRSLIERIGGFSEAHFRHMDYEFGMRSHRLQARVAYEPSLLVYAPVDPACLTKRYFRRWAFKAGIARDNEQDSTSGSPPPVPRWVYRQLLEDLLFVAFRGPLAQPPEAFSRQLRAWRGFGKVAAYWHQRLRPTRHAQWVQNYSQKKKNVY